MRFTRRKKLFVAGIAAVSLLGGSALAYWTQGGSGTGSATAGTTTAITVNQTNAAITSLRPGGPSAALSGNFDNPNPGSVNISSVTAIVRTFSSQGDNTKPACTQADFAIGGTSGTNTVPSGIGVGAWSGLTVALLENNLNQDNCKNVAINIDYTANS